jgi:hypothetical protein
VDLPEARAADGVYVVKKSLPNAIGIGNERHFVPELHGFPVLLKLEPCPNRLDPRTVICGFKSIKTICRKY